MVLAVVVAVLVSARWEGVRVPGSGISIRTIGVPAAGDCIAALTGPTPPLLPLVFGAGAEVIGDRSVVFSGCAAAHVGEVVAFRRFGPAGDDDTGSDAQWCTQVAIGYGLRPRWQAGVVTAAQPWRPVLAYRFAAILSGADADAQGRRWAACAVLAPGLESYQGSFLSLADSAAPAPFGFCRTGELSDQRVSCDTPHGEQVFATAVSNVGQRQDGCLALVQQATEMSDVTGGGRLQLSIAGPGPLPSCRIRVVGPAQLTGTLIGIGDAPLPLRG